jgi:hypothetical protein
MFEILWWMVENEQHRRGAEYAENAIKRSLRGQLSNKSDRPASGI